MQHDLDLEEALLERRADAVDGHLQELPGEESPPDHEGAERRETRESPSGDDGLHDREQNSRDDKVNALLADELEAESDPQGSGARG